MRFLITSVTGRKGYKTFQNLNEYVDFMTKKGHLIGHLGAIRASTFIQTQSVIITGGEDGMIYIYDR